MDRLAFYAQRKGITAKTTPGDFNHLQDHIEAAIKAAIKDTFPVPAVLSATDMAVTASVPADWNVNISAGPGYDEYGGRVYNPLAALLDVGPTAYANPAAGNEYYLRVVARADRTESAPRVTATGGTENFHEADAVELTCIQGVEALIGAAVVPAALAGDITLAVVRRFAGQANVAAGNIATTLRDELANFIRYGDAATVSSLDASGDVQGSQLISDVAAGTPPLVVASPTEVPNLNADKVGGIQPTVGAAGFFYFAGDSPFSGTSIDRTQASGDGNSWLSVGPTGSGATVIWTALDAVPAGAKGIRLNIYGAAEHGAGATAVWSIWTFVRKTGAAAPSVASLWVCSDLQNERNYNQNCVDVQLDANRKFEFFWNKEGVGPTSLSLKIFLEGWFI